MRNTITKVSCSSQWILCFLFSVAFSISGESQSSILRSVDGVVQFISDAPLEMIKARSVALRGVIDVSENTFAFAIDMKSFSGFNSDLQKTHFNENYVESRKFPRATFSGKIIEKIDWEQEALLEVRAKGMLEIHGIKQERIIPGKIEIFSDRVIIQSEFSVPLKDHDISIPKIVAQKISEKINVSIFLTILREAPTEE
ncbi:MAG: YceI family protein [Saprospiraceae bacterium]|nr:YceI family protein [Saprospiraceae bacterium]